MNIADRLASELATNEHPPVAAFIDLVYLVEDGAPMECIRDAVGELRRHGYIVSPPPPRKPARATVIPGTIAPRSANGAGSGLPTGGRSATFERERAGTLAGPGPFVDPSRQPSPPSSVGEMTPLGPIPQKAPLQ